VLDPSKPNINDFASWRNVVAEEQLTILGERSF